MLTAQSLEFGVGIRGNFNALKGNEDFIISTYDNNEDTIYLKFTQSKMNFSYNIPIFLRYRGKKGFWAEFSLTREKLAATGNGLSNYSSYFLENYANQQMLIDYTGNDQLIQYFPTFEDFYNAYNTQYYSRAEKFWEEDVEYTEITQYNNISFNFGYTFLRTKRFRPFIMGGLEWNAKSHKNSYQSLKYQSDNVNDYYTIYKKLPKLSNHIFFLNVGAGLELFNMQLGIHLRQSLGNIRYAVGVSDASNLEISQDNYYKFLTSMSFYLKYSLFQFNLRSSTDRKKLKEDEMRVLGDYQEKSKIVKLTAGVEVSVYGNVKSYSEIKQYSDSSNVDGSQFYLYENLKLENNRIESGINEVGDFVTDTAKTLVGLGNVKQVNLFPRLYFTVELRAHKYVSFDLNLSYQFMEFDTEARVLKQYYDWENLNRVDQQFHTVFRQTINQLSSGVKLNLKYDVMPGFFIGINGGFNFNFNIISKHKFEYPGYNADPIFHEFDKYLVRGDNSKDWNQIIGNGDLNDTYSYQKYDEISGDYVSVSENNLMNGVNGKFWTTWTVGIDFYYDKLRVSPFIEGRVTDLNFLYQDFLRLGVGFFFYLRK